MPGPPCHTNEPAHFALQMTTERQPVEMGRSRCAKGPGPSRPDLSSSELPRAFCRGDALRHGVEVRPGERAAVAYFEKLEVEECPAGIPGEVASRRVISFEEELTLHERLRGPFPHRGREPPQGARDTADSHDVVCGKRELRHTVGPSRAEDPVAEALEGRGESRQVRVAARAGRASRTGRDEMQLRATSTCAATLHARLSVALRRQRHVPKKPWSRRFAIRVLKRDAEERPSREPVRVGEAFRGTVVEQNFHRDALIVRPDDLPDLHEGLDESLEARASAHSDVERDASFKTLGESS